MEQIKPIDVLTHETTKTEFQEVKSTNFFLKYKWHFVFWIVYFIYSFGTDKIMMGDGMTFPLEVILISTHHVFLFYSFLYCLRRFSSKDLKGITISASRILLVILIFLSVRIYLNSSFFPWLYKIEGKVYQPLGPVEMNIKATFYLIEFFIKSLAFFYIFKFAAEQRQLRQALIDNYEQKMALEANIVRAEKAEQVKLEYSRLETTFINLVHETKTPLTIINNCIVEHVSANGTSPELEMAKKGVNKLSREISNIFDIQRYKHGKGIYDHEQLSNFSQIVNDNVSLYEYHARRKKIEIETVILPELYTFADPSAINRVINNLLENAIKYSDSGTVIRISLADNNGLIKFIIEDQGIGIDEEDLEKVFVPYLQLNKDKKNVQGLGLGLPLVKSIIDELGGRISIKNKKADNAHGIIVEISLVREEKKEIETKTSPDQYNTLIDTSIELTNIFHSEAHPNILVVEDDIILNSYMVTKLGTKFNVKYALNGRDAIEILKFEIPDLIISDVMMDQMTGFEMAEIISANPNFSHIPLIFLTARGTEKDKLLGVSLGAVDYIEKPFTLELLVNKVESILSQRDKRDQKLFNAAYQSMKSLLKSPAVTNQETESSTFEGNCKMYELTKTQVEIARLLIEGKTMKAIASDRNISESTVESHRRNLYEKLMVNNKTELIKKLTS